MLSQYPKVTASSPIPPENRRRSFHLHEGGNEGNHGVETYSRFPTASLATYPVYLVACLKIPSEATPVLWPVRVVAEYPLISVWVGIGNSFLTRVHCIKT